MSDTLVLIGGGGHCRSVIDVIERQGRYRIAAIVDRPEKRGQKVLGYEINAADNDLPALAAAGHSFLVTLAHIKDPGPRLALFEKMTTLGARPAVVISPLAYVSPSAHIGEGTVVMHQALVNAGARVGRNCIVNTKALVEHDAVIEDHVHLATAAIVNGGARIGRASFVGSNAVVRENMVVEPNQVIGFGEKVGHSRSSPAGSTALRAAS